MQQIQTQIHFQIFREKNRSIENENVKSIWKKLQIDFEFKCENIENRNVKPSWNNKYKWCVNIYRAGKWKIGAKREKKNCGRLKSTNDTTNTHFEEEKS